ncbi:MAG TPA: transposase [Chthonomonadaceae bacterium]|nr:transposase [Chthonomonadaceae bacterium]
MFSEKYAKNDIRLCSRNGVKQRVPGKGVRIMNCTVLMSFWMTKSARTARLQTGRVIAVLPDRKEETLLACFSTWSASARAAVEQVALELWEPYLPVSEVCFPQARPVADRFHVMKLLAERATTARCEIQRALPEAARQTLKGCRWLLFGTKPTCPEPIKPN